MESAGVLDEMVDEIMRELLLSSSVSYVTGAQRGSCVVDKRQQAGEFGVVWAAHSPPPARGPTPCARRPPAGEPEEASAAAAVKAAVSSRIESLNNTFIPVVASYAQGASEQGNEDIAGARVSPLKCMDRTGEGVPF